MIKGKNKQELTMESILSKISEFDVFSYYMPHKNWELNTVTLSPFREERNGSFLIGNKRGYISYIDFGDTSKRGDCFKFVQQLYSLSTLNDTLSKIDTDFKLGIRNGIPGDYKEITKAYKQPEVTKRNTFIQVETRKFTSEELAYWAQYHQTEQDLRDNNIYSIKKVLLNKQKFFLKDEELRFGYFYDGFWKIYRPFASKKEKWGLNNVPITKLDGAENIKNCDIALITKSKKCGMVLRKIYPHVVATQNEGIGCFSLENVEYFKSNSKRQVLLYDSDIQGVQASQQITKVFNFEYCNVPKKYLSEGIKDFSDLAAKYDLKTVENVLKDKNII